MAESNDVATAFKILLEELDTEVVGLNEEGARSIRSGDYGTAQEIAERARWVSAFRKRVETLQKEWEQWSCRGMLATQRQNSGPAAVVVPVVGERLHRGSGTPAGGFRRPILEALVERGGTAPAREVLHTVYERLKDHLSEHDRQPIPSNPNEPRWRKSAHWCRFYLVREGLLAPDSRRGIWKITQRGREELARLSQPDGEAKNETETQFK